jgi:acetyl-CoA carboxylase biotin carboxyl carrier protein
MNPQKIKEFLKSIKHTDIEELEYHSGDNSLYFKKSEVEDVVTPIPVVKEVPIENKQEDGGKNIVPIKSTLVGTFMNVPNADKTSIVKEGSHIVVGQKIGQIEAMKIIKDVKTKIKGQIVKVLISDGQAVEYGQELFLVDTSK